MRDFLLVGTGSFVGGVCRYYLGGWLLHTFAAQKFPISTLVVNFVGCLIIGILGALAEHHHMFSQSARLILMTGLLGGFTTFSAFGYETFFLIRTHGWDLALANIFISVISCLAAVWVGFRLTQVL